MKTSTILYLFCALNTALMGILFAFTPIEGWGSLGAALGFLAGAEYYRRKELRDV